MKKELAARLAELSGEIRNYPTPIARCDEQLTGLLEERARVLQQLTELPTAGGCSPLSVWINDGGLHVA